MVLKTTSAAIAALAISASAAFAGSLSAPVIESEPSNDPFIAAAPASGSLGSAGVGAALVAALVVGLVPVASDGT